jgi:hypothetical protein
MTAKARKEKRAQLALEDVIIMLGKKTDDLIECFLNDGNTRMDASSVARPFAALEWADMRPNTVGDLRLLVRASANGDRALRRVSAGNVIQYLDSVTQDAFGGLDPGRVTISGYARSG